MRIKERPEDFEVHESYRFDPDDRGEWRVYLMDKQKVGTLEAVERIRDKWRLKREQFSYCGLKDKQGRTTQLLGIRAPEVQMQEADLRLKLIGRTREQLSSANITSNRFSVTVRDLSEEDLGELPASLSEVNRLGVVNYFDSQRFGHLKHGQGLIARDLLKGNFEAALKSWLAIPSELDRTPDARVKAFWRDHWGQWTSHCPYPEASKTSGIIRHLQEFPTDFQGAFMRINRASRAMVLFTYQSYLWNESVRRYLAERIPREQLFALPYQAGTLLFTHEAPLEVLRELRKLDFPLLGPETIVTDEPMRHAVEWVLGREHIGLAELRVPGEDKLYFRDEPRRLLIYPGKLVIGKPREDDLHPGRTKVNVAFTLPPGAYATLVVKRLFWFSLEKTRRAELESDREEKVRQVRQASIDERKANPPLGYRAQQKLNKEQRQTRRAAAPPPKKKKKR